MKKILCGKFGRLFFLFYDPIAYAIRFFLPEKKRPIPEDPKILLCCFASLGDVLLATFIIPEIKKRFPCATIGFLCAPNAREIVKNNLAIERIHLAPSWMKGGRSKVRNLFSLVWHFFFCYPKVVQEIRKINYDISIELHPFFPNTIPLSRRAKISNRVGFSSGGYDVWLTHKVAFPKIDRYLPKLYCHLLKSLGIQTADIPCKIPKKGCSRQNKKVILHMGTFDPRKLWEIDHWDTLGKKLKEKGYDIVLTGYGESDSRLINQTMLKDFSNNLCCKLSIDQLFQEIEEAALLISIDSFPLHIAASLDTPCIGIYLFNANVELWMPEIEKGFLFVQNNCIRRSQRAHSKAIYLEKICPFIVESHAFNLLEANT